VLGASRVNEADGLAIVEDLGELDLEEGVPDVELASLPFKGKRDGEMTRTISGLTTELNVSSKSMPCDTSKTYPLSRTLLLLFLL
jgi:hypothetical protein